MSRRRRPSIVRAAAMVSLISLTTLTVACSDDEPVTSATPPSFTLPPTTTTTTTATTASTPVTEGPTASDPDVSTPAVSTPLVSDPAGTEPSVADPTGTVTTTTEPVAVQELILRGDGIGSARFGAAPQGVVEYVTSLLGGNTGDTGWVDPFAFADCGAGGAATKARRVDWGVLSLLFSDASSYAIEREHFIGYEYGRVGEIGDEPVGLHTAGNIGLGSRVVDLYAEFPDASVNEGDDEVGIPPNYYVSDVFYGLLTGTATDDLITVIFGGYGCGE